MRSVEIWQLFVGAVHCSKPEPLAYVCATKVIACRNHPPGSGLQLPRLRQRGHEMVIHPIDFGTPGRESTRARCLVNVKKNCHSLSVHVRKIELEEQSI